MDALDLIGLTALMQRSGGNPDVRIGIIDGPVAIGHPDLTPERLHEISQDRTAACNHTSSTACLHGTFIAGILSAKRNSVAPAICPDCTFLVRPIFSESTSGNNPSATPQDLARAIIDCIDAGARLLNLSLALVQQSNKGDQILDAALHQAVRRGVIVTAAAGNQGLLGSTALTRHPWVIPVVACDLQGRPMSQIEFRWLDRQARIMRARRSHYESGCRWSAADARRDERGGAVRHRGRRAVVV